MGVSVLVRAALFVVGAQASYCVGGPSPDAQPNNHPVTRPEIVHVRDFAPPGGGSGEYLIIFLSVLVVFLCKYSHKATPANPLINTVIALYGYMHILQTILKHSLCQSAEDCSKCVMWPGTRLFPSCTCTAIRMRWGWPRWIA